ncbi:MAG: YggT family protein [Candidatus Rokubacteria bacterium]|nr:YggT family protein [Candidatus Rokubacteria bacterium]MBI3825751.1 YggT family protein [Candidatus Rokubacteria bacterium]
MFIAEHFMIAVARLVDYVLWAYMILIIARVVVSWVSADRYNPIVRFISRTTEPVLGPIRRRLPDLGGLDISPMVVILGIYFLREFVVSSLLDMALALR